MLPAKSRRRNWKLGAQARSALFSWRPAPPFFASAWWLRRCVDARAGSRPGFAQLAGGGSDSSPPAFLPTAELLPCLGDDLVQVGARQFTDGNGGRAIDGGPSVRRGRVVRPSSGCDRD